jgi:hypothetical protein
MHGEMESETPLRFRGPGPVVGFCTVRGVQTVQVSVAIRHSGFEARCVNRQRSCNHKVPRRCARLTAVLRGSACSRVSACSSIERAVFRRCVGGQAPKLAGLHRGPSIGATTKGELRCQGAESASETPRLRQSNYAFERPVKLGTPARGQRAIHFAPSARLMARRAAAQRER